MASIDIQHCTIQTELVSIEIVGRAVEKRSHRTHALEGTSQRPKFLMRAVANIKLNELRPLEERTGLDIS